MAEQDGIEFVENNTVTLEVEQNDEPQMNEDDPRAAIYKKARERREAERAPVEEGPIEPKQEEIKAPIDDDVVVKVNGKERKVPRSKVDAAGGIDAYQKNAAASEMLNQAAAEKRRLMDIEAELEKRRKQLLTAEQEINQRSQTPQAPPPDKGEMKKLAKQYHEAVFNGEMDQADDLLIQLQAAQIPATPDENKIVRKAVAEARAEADRERREEQAKMFRKELNEELSAFNDNYGDIASDPELLEMANQKTAKIFRSNAGKGPKEIISEAVREVREWMKEKGISKHEQKTEDRQERKRSLNPVRSATARSAPKPQQKALSNSDYVEMLRKQRGLGI